MENSAEIFLLRSNCKKSVRWGENNSVIYVKGGFICMGNGEFVMGSFQVTSAIGK